MDKPITPADVTPAMRYRHIGQWRAYYIAALGSLTNTTTLKFPAHVAPAAGDLADAALAHELTLIPRLRYLEDKEEINPIENQTTHTHAR